MPFTTNANRLSRVVTLPACPAPDCRGPNNACYEARLTRVPFREEEDA